MTYPLFLLIILGVPILAGAILVSRYRKQARSCAT